MKVLPHRRRSISRSYIGFIWIAMAALILASACTKQQPKQQIPPAPVTVSQVIQKDMPVLIRAIGNVQPYSTVSVKSMINGQIIKVNFKEGQDVRKGDLLFVIEQAPFER